jgi:hypothetical protein
VDFLDKTLRETKVIETSFGVFGRRPRRWGAVAWVAIALTAMFKSVPAGLAQPGAGNCIAHGLMIAIGFHHSGMPQVAT